MQLRNNVGLQASLMARARGSDFAQVRRWLESRSEPGSMIRVVADTETDEAIGYLQAVDIDRDDRRADVGICLGPGHHGRGLGTEAMREFMNLLRISEAVGKVTLRVRADNSRAIACYHRLGFTQCGTLHAHAWFEEQWIDVVVMEAFLDTGRDPRLGNLARA
jgi:diamine N-acetyltransferase